MTESKFSGKFVFTTPSLSTVDKYSQVKKVNLVVFLVSLIISVILTALYVILFLMSNPNAGLVGIGIIITAPFLGSIVMIVLNIVLFIFYLIYLQLFDRFLTHEIKPLNTILILITFLATLIAITVNENFLLVYASDILSFLTLAPLFVALGGFLYGHLVFRLARIHTHIIILTSVITTILLVVCTLLAQSYAKQNLKYDFSRIDKLAVDTGAQKLITRRIEFYDCEVNSIYRVSPEKNIDDIDPPSYYKFVGPKKYVIYRADSIPDYVYLNDYKFTTLFDYTKIISERGTIKDISQNYKNNYFLTYATLSNGAWTSEYADMISFFGIYDKRVNTTTNYLAIYSKSRKICNFYGNNNGAHFHFSKFQL